MDNKSLFAVFPYLRIRSNRVKVRGIEFRTNGDWKGYPPEAVSNLNKLCEMFFLENDLRIKQMTCSYLEMPNNISEQDNLLRRVYEAQLLIAYIYSIPHQSGGVFLPTECAALFQFYCDDFAAPNTEVSSSLIYGSPELAERVLPVEGREIPKAKTIPAFSGTRNLKTPIWVSEGSRIYPEQPHITLNIHQDLSADLNTFLSQPQNWAFYRLYNSGQDFDDLPEIQNRLFIGLEWYMWASRAMITETEAILGIAIALESLLRVPEGERLTERFKDAVLTLVGPVPRLDSWLDQFYKARSKAVHEGVIPHLEFYALDKVKLKRGDNKFEDAIPHRPLTDYGRRIFRLCFATILSSATGAQAIGFPGLFIHNKERIDKICAILSNSKIPSPERLLDIRILVLELNIFDADLFEPHVEIKSVLGAIQLLLNEFLATHSTFSPIADEIINKVLQVTSENAKDKFTQIEKSIGPLRDELNSLEPSDGKNDVETVLKFFEYLQSSNFILKCHLEMEQSSSKDRQDNSVQ